MRETHLCTALRREILFIAACAAAAVLCVLSEHWDVDLNTADAAALCTLPGVGPSRARALIEYRQQYGPFARVADAAAVPGLTEDLVASWEGQATVNTPAQTMP